MCPQYISLAKMGCHFGSRIRTLILQDQRLSKVLVVVSHWSFSTFAAMADSLFDFELLDSADVLVDFDADESLNAVAAAETAQLETDQDEMAILADYVAPPNKTPEDLARDLEAMVTGVNTLSLQATEGTAVVVAPLAAVTTSSPTPPASSSAPIVATAAPPSGMVSSTPSSSPLASSLEPALASATDVLPGGTTASSVDIPKGPEEPTDVDMVQSLAPAEPVEPSVATSDALVPMDTTPPGLETVSTTTSSRKRPLDRGDKAGALAGASGPDTGIPSAESLVMVPWLGELSREPRQVLHALILSLPKRLSRPQAPWQTVVSSPLRLHPWLWELPWLPQRRWTSASRTRSPTPLRMTGTSSWPMWWRASPVSLVSWTNPSGVSRWGRSWTYASSLTSPSSHLPTLHGLWKSTPSPRPRSWRKRSGRPNTCARAAAPWAIWRNFPSRKTRCLSCVANALPVGLSRRLPNAFTVELWARWSRRHYPRPLWQWMGSPGPWLSMQTNSFGGNQMRLTMVTSRSLRIPLRSAV